MMRPYLIAVTGGIGSGKSIVCKILVSLGFPVYDCDMRAKALMDESEEIRNRIAREISDKVIDASGVIDRKALSKIVFADAESLQKLNEIVHGSVKADLLKWAHSHPGLCFVETAILYQSGLDKIVEEVWEVVAPHELKISRVMQRNDMAREAVEARINAQNIKVAIPHPRIKVIHNDGFHSVLLQLDELLKVSKNKA